MKIGKPLKCNHINISHYDVGNTQLGYSLRSHIHFMLSPLADLLNHLLQNVHRI